jgi:gluconate kinase
MENKATYMIVKIVKINKTIFVETYTRKEWLQLFKECHGHCQEDKKEIFVYCHCKKNSKKNIERRGVTKLWIPKGILSN